MKQEQLFNNIMNEVKKTKQKKSFFDTVDLFFYLPRASKLASGLALCLGLLFGYIYNDNNEASNYCTYEDVITNIDCNTYINY